MKFGKLGVDFGTTRTVVARADRGNYPIVSFFDEAGDSHDWFPSVVAERDGELRFGWAALAVAADPSFHVVRSFKRFLSGPRAVPGQMVEVGSSRMTLGELTHRFLVALREAIARRSNARTDLGPRTELRSVVAVPANAHGAQRFGTLEAFRSAGFAPVAMLNEPSAAGFEYTHRHRDTLTSKRDHVVVYDLGGGTFDASLVRMRGRRHEVLATAGINQLGGDDFDEALARLAAARASFDFDTLDPRARERLLVQCRDAKERLNPSSRKVSIDLEHVLGASHGEALVPVADFYEACGPLVERSVAAMAPILSRFDAPADVSALEEIAGIYVVGGGSELPIVARALRQRFGRRVHRSPYASAAIAIGLAIACDDESGFELADRYSKTFGVFREGDAGSEITFDPIFTSDTALPERRGALVVGRRDYRAAHNVGHFRFFECASVADDGRPRGDMMVSGDVLFPFDPSLDAVKDLASVPVQRLAAGEGPRIEEEYALDENGMVAVTIRNVDRGYAREFRIGG